MRSLYYLSKLFSEFNIENVTANTFWAILRENDKRGFKRKRASKRALVRLHVMRQYANFRFK